MSQSLDDSKRPLLSVIIPCFNQGQYLSQAIESILRQNYVPVEIIIVNDGSTEPGSKAVLNAFAAHNDQITVIHQENGGAAAARNVGLKKARGDFIQLLDADDILLPEKFNTQVDSLISHPQSFVAVGEYYFAPQDLAYFSKVNPSTICRKSYSAKEFILDWEKGLTIPIHSALFRSKVFQSVQFESTLVAREDWVFWISLVETFGENVFLYSPRPVCVYRLNRISITSDTDEMVSSWGRASQLILNRFGHLLTPIERARFETENKQHLSNFVRFRKSGLIRILQIVKNLVKSIMVSHPLIHLIAKRVVGDRAPIPNFWIK